LLEPVSAITRLPPYKAFSDGDKEDAGILDSTFAK
jgi:hypothetical protein